MKLKPFILSLVLVLPRVLCAQDPGPKTELPKEPLLKIRAPDFASWMIANAAAAGATRATNEKPSPDTGTKTTVVKTNGLMLRSYVDKKGQVWNTWCSGKTQVTIYPNQKDSVVQDSASQGTSIFYVDYAKTDFPDFDWVNLASYAGTKTYKGRPCLVFHGHRDVESWAVTPVPITKGSGDGQAPVAFDPAASFSITVYIDSETRLPAAIQDGTVIQEFTFLPAPKEMLTFPDPVNQLLNQRGANFRALTRTVHVQS